jgi:hypothetical protein
VRGNPGAWRGSLSVLIPSEPRRGWDPTAVQPRPMEVCGPFSHPCRGSPAAGKDRVGHTECPGRWPRQTHHPGPLKTAVRRSRAAAGRDSATRDHDFSRRSTAAGSARRSLIAARLRARAARSRRCSSRPARHARALRSPPFKTSTGSAGPVATGMEPQPASGLFSPRLAYRPGSPYASIFPADTQNDGDRRESRDRRAPAESARRLQSLEPVLPRPWRRRTRRTDSSPRRHWSPAC